MYYQAVPRPAMGMMPQPMAMPMMAAQQPMYMVPQMSARAVPVQPGPTAYWEEKLNTQNGHKYYVHSGTGASVYQAPDWWDAVDNQGKVYYYNIHTKQSTYERPPNFCPIKRMVQQQPDSARQQLTARTVGPDTSRRPDTRSSRGGKRSDDYDEDDEEDDAHREPDGDDEIEYILNYRVKGKRRQYLVHWKGTDPEDDEWFNRRDLMKNIPDLVRLFEKQHSLNKKRRGQSGEGGDEEDWDDNESLPTSRSTTPMSVRRGNSSAISALKDARNARVVTASEYDAATNPAAGRASPLAAAVARDGASSKWQGSDRSRGEDSKSEAAASSSPRKAAAAAKPAQVLPSADTGAKQPVVASVTSPTASAATGVTGGASKPNRQKSHEVLLDAGASPSVQRQESNDHLDSGSSPKPASHAAGSGAKAARRTSQDQSAANQKPGARRTSQDHGAATSTTTHVSPAVKNTRRPSKATDSSEAAVVSPSAASAGAKVKRQASQEVDTSPVTSAAAAKGGRRSSNTAQESGAKPAHDASKTTAATGNRRGSNSQTTSSPAPAPAPASVPAPATTLAASPTAAHNTSSSATHAAGSGIRRQTSQDAPFIGRAPAASNASGANRETAPAQQPSDDDPFDQLSVEAGSPKPISSPLGSPINKVRRQGSQGSQGGADLQLSPTGQARVKKQGSTDSMRTSPIMTSAPVPDALGVRTSPITQPAEGTVASPHHRGGAKSTSSTVATTMVTASPTAPPAARTHAAAKEEQRQREQAAKTINRVGRGYIGRQKAAQQKQTVQARKKADEAAALKRAESERLRALHDRRQREQQERETETARKQEEARLQREEEDRLEVAREEEDRARAFAEQQRQAEERAAREREQSEALAQQRRLEEQQREHARQEERARQEAAQQAAHAAQAAQAAQAERKRQQEADARRAAELKAAAEAKAIEEARAAKAAALAQAQAEAKARAEAEAKAAEAKREADRQAALRAAEEAKRKAAMDKAKREKAAITIGRVGRGYLGRKEAKKRRQRQQRRMQEQNHAREVEAKRRAEQNRIKEQAEKEAALLRERQERMKREEAKRVEDARKAAASRAQADRQEATRQAAAKKEEDARRQENARLIEQKSLAARKAEAAAKAAKRAEARVKEAEEKARAEKQRLAEFARQQQEADRAAMRQNRAIKQAVPPPVAEEDDEDHYSEDEPEEFSVTDHAHLPTGPKPAKSKAAQFPGARATAIEKDRQELRARVGMKAPSDLDSFESDLVTAHPHPTRSGALRVRLEAPEVDTVPDMDAGSLDDQKRAILHKRLIAEYCALSAQLVDQLREAQDRFATTHTRRASLAAAKRVAASLNLHLLWQAGAVPPTAANRQLLRTSASEPGLSAHPNRQFTRGPGSTHR